MAARFTQEPLYAREAGAPSSGLPHLSYNFDTVAEWTLCGEQSMMWPKLNPDNDREVCVNCHTIFRQLVDVALESLGD